MIEFFKNIEWDIEDRYFFGELIVIIGKRFRIQVHEIQSGRKTSCNGIGCLFPFAGLQIYAISPATEEFVRYGCQGRLEKYYNTKLMKWAFWGLTVNYCNKSVTLEGEP